MTLYFRNRESSHVTDLPRLGKSPCHKSVQIVKLIKVSHIGGHVWCALET